MTPAAAWVLVGLAAILVGAAIPALFQLRKTLKAAQETLESTGRHATGSGIAADAIAHGRPVIGTRVDGLLDVEPGKTITLDRVERTAVDLERGVGRATSLFETLGGIGDALEKVRASVLAVTSIGSILGSALLAAFAPKPRDTGKEPERPEPLEQGERS